MRIFCRSHDANRERWDGPRTGVQGAVDVFAADEAQDVEGFATYLSSLLASDHPMFIDLPRHASAARAKGRSQSRSIFDFLAPTASSSSTLDFLNLGRRKVDTETVMSNLLGRNARPTRSLRNEVERLRTIKSSAELALLRKAATISSDAHARVMKFARPGMNESAMVAHFSYVCSLAGAERLAYVPVCAAGDSALSIHYTHNNQVAKSGSLVLIDAGLYITLLTVLTVN